MLEINNRLNNKNFEIICKELYKNNFKKDKQSLRYKNLFNSHVKRFNNNNVDFFSSPGRIEVSGNHTDHNNGKVICASINVDTLACASKIDNKNIIMSQEGFNEILCDVTELKISKNEFSKSIGLVRGVVVYFVNKGYKVGGFQATLDSNLYKGAGISSSACFSLLVAEILNYYYNNNEITFEEMAKAGQYAEYNYFGKPCGLMDQMAVAAGGIIYIDFEDLSKLKYERVDWPFDDLDIVLVNTGGSHSGLTESYSSIKDEMNKVASYFGKKVLREVDEDEFYNSINSLQKKVSGRAIQRAEHFFNENKRVEKILEAIKSNNKGKFISFINDSGVSSQVLLQNTHTENDTNQRIDLAISLSKSNKVKVESVRVHGGGFAGTILAIIKRENVNEYIDYMSKIFGEQNLFIVNIRNKGPIKLDI